MPPVPDAWLMTECSVTLRPVSANTVLAASPTRRKLMSELTVRSVPVLCVSVPLVKLSWRMGVPVPVPGPFQMVVAWTVPPPMFK